jgi:hypothetical protein
VLTHAICDLPAAFGDGLSTERAAIAEKARSIYKAGIEHYNRREYLEAIACFKEAYSLSNDGGLLFNIAQTERKNGDCRDAARDYRAYLMAKPSAADRDRVERRIAEMDACAGALPHSVTSSQTDSILMVPASLTTADQPSSSNHRGAGSIAQSERVALDRPVDEEERSTWVPWVLMGAGTAVGGVAGVAVFGTTARALSDCRPRCSPDQISALRTRVGVAYGLMGIGGATAAVGLIFGVVEWTRDPPVSIGWVAPDAPGLLARGRF